MRNSEFRYSDSMRFLRPKGTCGFLLLVLTALSSFGQSVTSKTNDCPSCTCICIQGSIDFANIIESGNSGSYSIHYSNRIGFNVGVFVFQHLKQISNGQLLLKGGLQFIQKGSEYSPSDLGDFHGTATLGYLEIPIDILYQFHLGDNGGPFAGLGPYFAYGVGGKNKFKFNGYPFSENSFSDSTFKRFDAGLNLTAGYRISCTWSFSIAYELGLVNIVNSNNSGVSGKNQVFSINVAYCLGRLLNNK